MCKHDLLTNVESESSAGLTTCGFNRGLGETLKQLIKLIFGNAGTFIGYPEEDPLRLGAMAMAFAPRGQHCRRYRAARFPRSPEW